MKGNGHPHAFHRLVVGLDEEGRSDHAVLAAVQLAGRLGADVQLVHAAPIPRSNWPGINPIRLAALNATALTTAWKQLTARLVPLLRATPLAGRPLENLLRVLPGPPAKVLLEESTRLGADLILIGPHRRRGVLDFGSTARAVLAKGTCPVWIQNEEPRAVERLLVPIDLSDESLETLLLARDLARSFGARVQVLHCFVSPVVAYPDLADTSAGVPVPPMPDLRDSRREQLDKAVRELDWRGVEHAAEFVEHEPADQILSLEQPGDLVVIGTHGETALTSAVLGGVAYRVLRDARGPVLAVRHPDRSWLV